MQRLWPRVLATLVVLLLWTAAAAVTPGYAQQPSSASKSWTDTITSPFKQGFDKLGSVLSPKPSHASLPEDDAVSLKSSATPGPELYVAIARLYEQKGETAEAERQYQLALKLKSDDLPALLGYAHLKEGQDKPDEAIQIYQRAAKAHPREASVYNNLGLCHARQKRLDEAVAAISAPSNWIPRTDSIATTSRRCWWTKASCTRRSHSCGKYTSPRRRTTTWATC